MFGTGRPKHLGQLADDLLVMFLKRRDDFIHILSRGCSGWRCWSGGPLVRLGFLLPFGLWLGLVSLGSLLCRLLLSIDFDGWWVKRTQGI